MNFELNERGGWIIPAGTELPGDTQVPAFSEIGDWCTLGDRCTLGDGCTLGDRCTLGDGCAWLGVTILSWLTLGNVDGTGRQVKMVKHEGGIMVEAGCFCGTLEEFVDKAAAEGKDRYARVVSAVAEAM